MKSLTTASSSKTKKRITLAKHAGFCYGVKRAVETTKRLKVQNPEKEISVLGELIHNSQVIQELEEMGIKKIDNIKKVENADGICVIRSHGVPSCVYEEIEKKGFEIADLTCPDVKKVHNKAFELVKDGYTLIIIGKPEHPEVIAISANAQTFSKNVFVTPDVDSVKKIETELKSSKKIGVVVQTTQRIAVLQEIVAYLLTLNNEVKVFNTICPSTSLRQNEAKNLARQSDLMIVAGSKNSANTSHLAEILREITTTLHIEKAEELANFRKEIENATEIGVTAGASAPDYLINEILNELEKY